MGPGEGKPRGGEVGSPREARDPGETRANRRVKVSTHVFQASSTAGKWDSNDPLHLRDPGLPLYKGADAAGSAGLPGLLGESKELEEKLFQKWKRIIHLSGVHSPLPPPRKRT